MRRTTLPALLAVSAACAPQASTCRVDGDCHGAEICTYGTCDVVACNSDDGCAEHVCVDGICAGAPAPQPESPGTIAATVVLCGITSVDPLPDAATVSVMTDIVVDFEDATVAAAATIKVSDESGAEVATARVADGAKVVASPEGVLDAGAHYRVVITRACGADAFDFTTAAPIAVDESMHTLNVTWDIAQAEVFPKAAAQLLMVASPNPPRIALSANHGTLAFTADGEQRTCEPTIPLAGESPNPTYSLFGGLEGDLVTKAGVRSVKLRGVATPAGADLEGIVVADARMSGNRTDANCLPGNDSYPSCAMMTCALVAALGTACGPCEDGAPYCVTFTMRSLAVPGPPVVDKTLDEICADATCAGKAICQ